MFSKVVHMYWGMNQPLSYLRALSVMSFHKLNPDWEIKVWVPSVVSKKKPWTSGEQPEYYTGHDYLQNLLSFVCEVDFPSIGIPNDTPEVHKADLLRWYLMGEYGGIWSDMDILFVKPVPRLDLWHGAGLCKTKAVRNSDKEYSVIGFLTSEGVGKIFFQHLYDYGLEKLPQDRYQAFGAELLDKFIGNWYCSPNLPFYHNPNVVYPLCTGESIRQYFQPVELQYGADTIGLHWFAGNPEIARLESCVTHQTRRDYTDKFAICRELLKL